MSTWIEKGSDTSVSDAKTADVVFKLDCQRLPVDHSAELANSICTRVPWLFDLPLAGIHAIHVAGSQNGWSRPESQSGEWLELSRRTRLRIRVPIECTSQLIAELSNQPIDVAGQHLQILNANVKTLYAGATLFSRYTVFNDSDSQQENEDQFLSRVTAVCESIGFTPNKLMCGRTQHIQSSEGTLLTRSVLLADVPVKHSLQLQDAGIGDNQLLGCGIVIPHKDTSPVN